MQQGVPLDGRRAREHGPLDVLKHLAAAERQAAQGQAEAAPGGAAFGGCRVRGGKVFGQNRNIRQLF